MREKKRTTTSSLSMAGIPDTDLFASKSRINGASSPPAAVEERDVGALIERTSSEAHEGEDGATSAQERETTDKETKRHENITVEPEESRAPSSGYYMRLESS